jgi:hypothetical protein
MWFTDRYSDHGIQTGVSKLGKHWRRLNGSELIPKVVTGVQFVDGEELHEQAA